MCAASKLCRLRAACVRSLARSHARAAHVHTHTRTTHTHTPASTGAGERWPAAAHQRRRRRQCRQRPTSGWRPVRVRSSGGRVRRSANERRTCGECWASGIRRRPAPIASGTEVEKKMHARAWSHKRQARLKITKKTHDDGQAGGDLDAERSRGRDLERDACVLCREWRATLGERVCDVRWWWLLVRHASRAAALRARVQVRAYRRSP